MDGAKGTILIVDDEEPIRSLISRKLQAEGYDCVVASDGSEAVATASKRDFDLVLTDIKMPGMSGIEVLSQIVSDRPDTGVVMISAVADTQTAVKAMKLGAYDYVTKPFELDALGMRVEKALEKRRLLIERKQAQEQLLQSAKLAAIGELVSGVAHELNNPLAAISMYSELLLEETEDEGTKQRMLIISRQAERAITIVENLLSFARKQEPKRSYTSINDSITSAVELRAYDLNLDNIKVTLDPDPDLPSTMADFHQLQQVFFNIITNAEQAIREAHGKGNIVIRTQKKDELIRITIADDGPGIAANRLNRIFEPFFTTKDVGKGTGLGLSICHGIIQEHGGQIYVESTEGEGVTFVIEIPIIAEADDCGLNGQAHRERLQAKRKSGWTWTGLQTVGKKG